MWNNEALLHSSWLDSAAAFSAGFAFSSAFLTILTMSSAFKTRWADHHEIIQIIATALAAMFIALPFANIVYLTFISSMTVIICVFLRAVFKNFSMAGICYIIQMPMIIATGLYWYISWISGTGFTGWYFAVIAIIPVLNATEALLDYILYMGTYSLFIRKVWHEPFAPAVSLDVSNTLIPFVSVHVPCHAEPPELVILTIEALSLLDYPNYEVIVCDNNTDDEELWKPVEARCRELNEASGQAIFRFCHVKNLKGAKAGALNYCLDMAAPDTQLIAIVDADYIAETNFLRRLTPLFSDPLLDFVQTSHDYYDQRHSIFNQSCYWEYLLSTKFSMAGLNELHASFTIGTMCILRRKAVEDAGRWAEWCLTEDSEIAVRLRAQGGKGLYFRDTFGRGTIPGTFTDWKNQRFRWTAGPVQQLMTHWRLFLPHWAGGSQKLSGWSKVFEIARSIQMLSAIITLIGVLIVAAGMLIMAPQVPAEKAGIFPLLGFFIAFSLSAHSLILTGMGFWLAGCRSFRMMFAAMGAGAALSYIRMVATVAALLHARLRWKRTPKFTSRSGRIQALEGTFPETLLAIIFLILLVLVVSKVNEIGWLAVLITGSALLRFFLSFLSAPVMAILSVKRA